MDSLFTQEEYDTEINGPLMQHRSGISNAVSTLFGGAVATVVDVGASIFNSLPGDREVYTEDILAGLSQDALRVYQEHPDAVRTASLIGGSFIPGGIALKGMNLARSGVKGASWLSNTRKAADVEKAALLISQGKKATTEYKNLLWGMRARTIGNNAIDAVAAEAAIVGTFNAHPYMEDYMEDLPSNFGLGVLLGTGVGAVGGLVADAYKLNKAGAATEARVLEPLYEKLRPVSEAMPNTTKLQTNAASVRELDNILATAASNSKIPANDLTAFYADKLKKELTLQNGNMLEEMLDPVLRNLDAPDKGFILKELEGNPAMWGVQKVKPAKLEGELPAGRLTQNLLLNKPVLSKVVAKTGETKLVEAIYFPDTKRFGTAADVKLHAGASILGTSEKALVAARSSKFNTAPNFDYSFEQIKQSTAHVEADYIGWTSRYAKMEDAEVLKHLTDTIIADKDLAQLQAVAVRLQQSPALATQAKVRVTSEAFYKTGRAPNTTATPGIKLPPVPGSKRYVEAALSDVVENLIVSKHTSLLNLISRGFPPEVIAKRLNLPPTTVDKFFGTSGTLDSFKALGDFIHFKSAEEGVAALSIRNRPLALHGAKGKADYTQHHANLNVQQLNTINKMYVSTHIMNSDSTAVRELGSMLFDRYDAALGLASKKLSLLNNQSAGSSFFSSADHALRGVEDLGPIFTAIGKDLTHLKNATIQRLLTPMTAFMESVAKNEAALVEFNIAANVNAGLSGWRIYKDRQFWQKAMRLDEAGKEVAVLEPVLFQGKSFMVVTKEADELLQNAARASKELYAMKEASSKILGTRAIANNGFWLPAMNPINKFIAYIHDKAADTTRMVYARSELELNDALKSFAAEQMHNPNLITVTKDNQRWWSYVNGRLDTVNMHSVDASKLKTGAGASAIISTNRDILSEIAGGYEHYINSELRNLADISMSGITDTLRQYSKLAASAMDGQPLSFVQKVLNNPKDSGKTALNVLLGQSSLDSYEGWQTTSRVVDAAIAKSVQAVTSLWKDAAPRKGLLNKGIDPAKMKDFDYEQFDKMLQKEGVVNPFAVYDNAAEKYRLSKHSDNPEVPKRIIAAGNSLAATMALRFGELAHPLVNLMSMPILATLANGKSLPATFLGAKKQTANVSTMRVMYEGIRGMGSPRFKHLNNRWEELGYFEPLVSEATEIHAATRKFEKGALASLERGLDSTFVKVMSKGSDYSEALSRKIMMNTGYQLGKRMYPDLSDTSLTIFANDFMNKSIGNYSAAQRPVMFQGTAGMAMGLFQTYMLTIAQGAYRSLEIGDWATLAKASMAQSTIFGTSSMPGFGQVSELIGEHFSDDHFDLTTGTYRAAGEAADSILYGLPSVLSGASIYSRGSVDPRFPNVLAGVDNIAAVNMATQASQSVLQVVQSIGEGNDTGQALLQAMSLQSLSRPLARLAEVGMAATGEGGSINRAGATVQNSAEVWTANGIMARVFAMRPMEEGKLREAQYLNRFYEAADNDDRKVIINALRTSIRNGSNEPEKIAVLAEEYMRKGGSPTGWRSMYRTALARTNIAGEDTFVSDLEESSPFLYMMDNLD